MKRFSFQDVTLVEDAPYMQKPFAFHIEVNGKKHYYLRGNSFAEQQDWIMELTKRSTNMKKLPEGTHSLSHVKFYPSTSTSSIESKPKKTNPVPIDSIPSSSNSVPSTEKKGESEEEMNRYHTFKETKQKKEKSKIRLVYVYGDNEEKKVDLTGAACNMRIVKYETKNEGKRDMFTVINTSKQICFELQLNFFCFVLFHRAILLK